MFRNSLLNRNIAHKNLFPALVIVVLGLLMGNNTALMDHNFSRENVMYNCACYFAGDSSHPDNPDLVGDGDEPEIQQTILESRLSAKRLHRIEVCKISLSFRFRISLSDMTNYKLAFGKVCRIKNRQTFKSMPILYSAYHAVKYAELRIGILLKVCRFVIRHITTWYGMPN